MCGIFAYIGHRRDAKEIVFEGLKKLEYRGYDSWGIAAKSLRGQILSIEKHVGKIGGRKVNKLESNVAIGHTRWATHGGATKANAHPHLDCTGLLVVVHNGIVENFQGIKASLIEKGHRFVSQTDTEVIAHLIEEEEKTLSFEKAVFRVFRSLEGLNAILVLDAKNGKIVACRNGPPLVVGLSDVGYFFSSDVNALLGHTNKVYFLLDGEGVVANDKSLAVFDIFKDKEKKFKTTTIDLREQQTNKGTFKHYLIKEIFEQREAVRRVVELSFDRVEKLSQIIRNGKYKNIIITGCGSAYNCGFLGKYFLANVGVNAQVCPANEISSFTKFFGKDTLFIAISQSGETADTLEAAKEARKLGAYIVGVVNTQGSTLERISHLTIPVFAGPEIAVVSTKAFINQAIILYFLSSLVKSKFDEVKKEFNQFFHLLDNWLNDSLTKIIKDVSKSLADKQSIFIIGRGVNYPAALEFALKIKETSYIHAEAFAAGELKHGVIALIEKGTPCFVLGLNDDYKKEILSSAMEVKARGGKIYGVAPFDSSEFDFHIKTFDAGHLSVISNVIVGQLLGYHLGVLVGADPDKPRNLAKSVTVK